MGQIRQDMPRQDEAAATAIQRVDALETQTLAFWADRLARGISPLVAEKQNQDILNRADIMNMRSIVEAVLDRAAGRIAVGLVAIMKKVQRNTEASIVGNATPADAPVGIVVEGSTFHRFTRLRVKIISQLDRLAEKEKFKWELLQTERTVLMGTAVSCFAMAQGGRNQEIN